MSTRDIFAHQQPQQSFKILIIGDVGTGKTSIIRRFVHNVYTNNYKATIGVDFALKVMNITPEQIVNLHLWDISGQDRYGVMTRVYYKDAHAAVIVMDSSRERTLEGALRWKADLDQKLQLADGSPIPAILLANKSDLDSSITDDILTRTRDEAGFIDVMRVSAKENEGIEDAFRKLVVQVYSTVQNGHYELPYPRGDVDLNDSQKRTKNNCSC